MGELDALLLPEHPECDKETGAVHACGHHCQSSALLGIAGVLSNSEIASKLCGKIRIVAVPAEELIEMDDRKQMRLDGVIKSLSGKSEFMRRGYFDDVDIGIMLHSDLREIPGLTVGRGMSGIVAKRVTFHGSKGVSGGSPINGINALYAANTAFTTINALREVFPQKKYVRIQSAIMNGSKSVQFMPSEVVIESNVRAYDYETLMDVNDKVNRAYAGAALAFGAQVTIEDMEVYIPENGNDSLELSQIAYEAGCDLLGQENVTFNKDWYFRSDGGTDMGNLGAVIPCIQPYICSPGIYGHNAKFEVKSPEYAVLYHAAILATMACVLLENGGEKGRKVMAEYTPVFSSMEEYFKAMDSIYHVKDPIEYHQDGSATLTWK